MWANWKWKKSWSTNLAMDSAKYWRRRSSVWNKNQKIKKANTLHENKKFDKKMRLFNHNQGSKNGKALVVDLCTKMH